ncbi:hypothetical protein [Streptomyces sp. ISL-12]|uniref:hypothetical protein n=1 Tax=Streptomyces sp. ISL-12 TaxID=2819177 RepID=UPI002034C748|nr:hypothetical protein [Streptomyces sp. ISL-12]
MYTPDPPSSHPAAARPLASGCRGGAVRAVGAGVGVGVGVGEGAGVVHREVPAVREGAVPGRSRLGDGPGERVWLRSGVGPGDAAGSCGADCATGAVGRVEPSTKWMVRMTAVTLAAVQHSQSSR